jgi:hypothetical protein
VVAKELDLGDLELINQTETLTEEVSKMLGSFIERLSRERKTKS